MEEEEEEDTTAILQLAATTLDQVEVEAETTTIAEKRV
jgi:hypothetical protein